MTNWHVVADVGGTNVRFARALGRGRLTGTRSYPIKDYENFQEALVQFLKDINASHDFKAVLIGAAGPVIDGSVTLTNGHWHINENELVDELGCAAVQLFNDLEAVAFALPYLGAADIGQIGSVGFEPRQRQRMIAVNVGTGFGAATILPTESNWISCPSEAGHMSLTSRVSEFLSPGEDDITGFNTVEDILSGPGLVSVYESFTARDDASGIPELTAADIFGNYKYDSAARQAVAVYTRLLGKVTGDLVLATAAWGGAFLVGSVNTGWHQIADVSLFRQHFEAKGKLSKSMTSVFTGVIVRGETALWGLSHVPVDTS